MATNNILQDRVKFFLVDTGRTQKWLAKKIDVSPQMLCMWLKDKVSLHFSTMEKIRKIIDAENY